jgi:hypothetical protein
VHAEIAHADTKTTSTHTRPAGHGVAKYSGNDVKCALIAMDNTTGFMSRKPDTIFGQGTITETSMPHIGKGVALVA